MRKKQKNHAAEDIKASEDDSFAISYSPNYLARFEDRVLNFHLLLSRLELVKANILLSNIKEAFGVSDSKLIKIKIKILESLLAYYQGVENNNIETIRWAALNLDELRPQLEELDLKPELWQVQRFLSWCLSRTEKSLSEQKNIQLDLENIIQQNQQLLDEMTSSLFPKDQVIFLLNKWTTDEESIAH